jgi:serine/threonine protein kinase
VNCPACNAEVLEIDVKCASCGAALGATGAHRMLGQTVLGQYELIDVLGQGGMSVVFKAKHAMTDQEVALKILPPELAAHSQVKGRFLEEAKALATLDHANIVHLYNFGQENGSFVLAMQYVHGRTWERLILENKRLDWKVSCRIAVDVLKALEYAHGRGVVHRDMKPSNVLVRAQDGSATVMDFGIAKMAQSTRLTATGQTMGTVRYMSPEQVRGQEVDLRTDLYSLGATLYESLVGDTPFDGSTHFEIMTKHLSEAPKRPSQHGVEVPAEVEDAVMRSLSKRATDRFENARDMRKIIENALRLGDVALVETQRLQREMIADLRPAKKTKPPPNGLAETARAATANDLADELEPGLSGQRTARRRSWPWVALALVVLGGGGTVAALLLTKPSGGYHPATEISGVTLTAGKAFKDLHVLVETDGTVTPDEVAAAYRSTLDALRAFDPKVTATYEVVETIIAIPQAAMCEPTAYPVASPPEDCKIALAEHAIGAHGSHNLLVVGNRAVLADAIRAGLARAVCEFQPADTEIAKLDKICEMTKRFGTTK